MLVASGIAGPCRETSVMPSMPGVGSSRYSRTPSSCLATLSAVPGPHAAFGSSRSGWPGKAARSAWIASISSSGGKTPPLSLIAVNP